MATTTANPATNTAILEVDPDAILIDLEIQSLRAWTGTSEQEFDLIGLQRSIQSEGQLEPGIVRETTEGYVLVSGERRLRAVQAARAEGETDLMFRVVVEQMSEEQAFRVAIHANKHANFTPIEFARVVKKARDKFGWQGKSGTANVADYLEVSPATITQAERLLTLPAEVQADLQAGRVLASTALEYANVKPEKVAEVRERAAEKAEAEEAARPVGKRAKGPTLSPGLKELKKKHKERLQREAAGGGVDTTAEGSAGAPSPVSASATGNVPHEVDDTPPEKPVIQGKHVRAAARELGAEARDRAPKMSDLLGEFEAWTEEDNYPRPMVKFAVGVVRRGHGKLSAKGLAALWEDLADSIPATKVKREAKTTAVKKSAKPAKKAVKKAAVKKVTKAAPKKK